MVEDDLNDTSFEAVADDQDDEARLPSLHDVLRSLPLVDQDHYIGMADGRPLFVISEKLQKAVAKLPKSSYGIRRVRMTLDDGTAHEGAIAWTRHIVWVKGHPMPPFEATRVVAVEELES